MKFRKKPVVVEAHQWFKNGDHPDDYTKDQEGLEGGEMRTFSAGYRRARNWEGDVVRTFDAPIFPAPCFASIAGTKQTRTAGSTRLKEGIASVRETGSSPESRAKCIPVSLLSLTQPTRLWNDPV